MRCLPVGERSFVFRYRSAAHCLEVFRTFYGPLLKTFAALDGPAQGALERDQFNRSGDGSVVVRYLEVVIARR